MHTIKYMIEAEAEAKDKRRDKKYYVINRFNGAVRIVYSKTRHLAIIKGREIFGDVALDLYSR